MNTFQDTAEKVKSHAENVVAGSICHVKRCPRCGGHPERFGNHGHRKRIFLAIDGNYVHRLAGMLARKRCPICRHTFTDYPPFAYPYKRYLACCVMEGGRGYLDEDRMTYRKAVRREGAAIAYEDGQDGSIDERQLTPSTVWRWLGFVGSMVTVIRKAVEMIGGKDPSSPLFRAPCVVASNKYRSLKRKMVLQRAVRLLEIEPVFFSLFSIRITQFATSYL